MKKNCLPGFILNLTNIRDAKMRGYSLVVSKIQDVNAVVISVLLNDFTCKVNISYKWKKQRSNTSGNMEEAVPTLNILLFIQNYLFI